MSKRYKVVITGSSGMLGIDLSRELYADFVVEGTDLVRNSKSTLKRFWKSDITDGKSITAVLLKARPDFVVHCAAWTDVDGCELNKAQAAKVNFTGSKNVALACKKCGATMIYISTDFVFDGTKKRPYRENDATHPLSSYGESKLRGERAVQEILAAYFILRTSWLYGENGKNFVDTIIAKGRVGSPLKIVNDQSGSPTYTHDLSAAIHALLDKAPGSRDVQYGIYHVSGAGKVSWFAYAREILRLAGCRVKVAPISSAELARPAERPAMSVMDNSKFRKLTGYRMRDWKTALREYVSYKTEGVCHVE